MAVEVAVMPSPHDAVSPVIYGQNAWTTQPLSPNVDSSIHAHSPAGSAPSPANISSPFSHSSSPLAGVCSPTAVHSPHMIAHSPGMQAASPLHCQPLNISVNVKQELSGCPSDFAHCNNLSHLLRSSGADFSSAFTTTLGHLAPPAQREILDGEFSRAAFLYYKCFVYINFAYFVSSCSKLVVRKSCLLYYSCSSVTEHCVYVFVYIYL